MGVWRVPADVMATSRFAISPRAEVVGALGALTRPRSPEQRVFGAAHGAAFAAWVASRPGVADLVAASFRDPGPDRVGWMGDYLSHPPEGDDATFASELAQLQRLTDDEVRADLRETTQAPLAPALMRPGVRDLVVELVVWLWTHTVETDWARRERILRADIVSRTAQLARHGWGTVLRDLGRDREWVGDGQLRINRYALPTPHAPGGQHAAVRADAHRRHAGSGGTPTGTRSTTRSRGGWPRSTPPAPPASGRSSGRAGPRCSPCSTPRAAPRSSRPSAARRSARSAATSRCCWRPASCCVAGPVARCSTGAPRWATRSSPPARRPEDRTAAAAATPTGWFRSRRCRGRARRCAH